MHFTAVLISKKHLITNFESEWWERRDRGGKGSCKFGKSDSQRIFIFTKLHKFLSFDESLF